MKKFLQAVSGAIDRCGKKLYTAVGALQGVPLLRYFKIFACSALLVLLVFYAAASLFYNAGGFSVSLRDKEGRLDKSGQLSLSETADFKKPTVQLKGEGGGLTNVSVASLPDNLEDPEAAAAEGFIIYTFYVKNSGNGACNVSAVLHIDEVVKNVDDAIRVRLYKNGSHTTYAKLSADGMREGDTTPFYDRETVFNDRLERFAPGAIQKYTVVIWLEGDDPECLDSIRGGNIKMSLTLSVEETSP